jgi:hypothetical protein
MQIFTLQSLVWLLKDASGDLSIYDALFEQDERYRAVW